MLLTAERNQRRDVRGRAERHIGLAEIAIVGQQCLGPAEIFPQDVDLLKHRRDLLLVIGRLNPAITRGSPSPPPSVRCSTDQTRRPPPA